MAASAIESATPSTDASYIPTHSRNNPDYDHEIYGTKTGIHRPGCGLDDVMLSWGGDEYSYHVVKEQSTLLSETLAMIRYHSFYPWHNAGAYRYLTDEKDDAMLDAVRALNPYGLYSKSDAVPNLKELKKDLIDEFFPHKLIK
ncbi:MAG: hypothetical protein M1818_006625 [Claussenomyces sp. TS43310]|nr:MAG: hypothetical protein M1818_006940 [Claussenomyces sp. TS43310]KAI9735048.1 MAG: hypothetical protein M1818_006625 [Claussenomyces sp. TS43310]